ncbi:similar to Eremothecium cymbalariae Ecym_3158 hypothetical protein [Maudiozyma saulgeensis]|uniref:Potassium transporter n=1 Tax=Maudiozyma saulgeensis TaxID=1789683 RepID=A0A1X7R9S4_9SACH|nr:similar to Eremothecium cymbalariae Ecym_3158 hypothetical protein [Kazachstania saulgeensis]
MERTSNSRRSQNDGTELISNRESCDFSNFDIVSDSTVDSIITNSTDSTISSHNNITSHHLEKKKSWSKIFVLSYSTLGSIYGDIGTSPLYTLSTIFAKNKSPTRKEVTGVISLIFWCFTLLVIVKYAFIVLRLGPNNGEGGQVAIYCKISNILHTGPIGVNFKDEDDNNENLLSLSRTETRGSFVSTESFFQSKNFGLLKNKKFKKFFATFTLGLCFLGGALVISDGLLTPTTSVLSAIEGIGLVVPSFDNKIMPVSVCILIVLFAVQPLGSQYISLAFSPIMLTWFVTIFVIGCINISKHPSVFKALNPAEAIYYLRDHRSIDVLGSVMLSLTGCEAMFADVGHFSALSVTLALCFVVYPSLMLMYLGQGAYLYDHPESISSVFFLSIPGGNTTGFYWFVFIFATLATIIASQALILGVFSIIKQMIQIDCFPHFKVSYKSAKSSGTIFIPSINFLLMICVVLTCVGFRKSSNVTAAYGLGVSIDFLLTTVFISLCMLTYYKVHWLVVLFFFLTFGSLEMCLIISNCVKIPHGAWFTIMVTAIMFSFFVFWRWCRVIKIKQERRDRKRLQDILSKSETNNDPSFMLGERIGHTDTNAVFVKPYLNKLNRYPGVAVMYSELSSLVNSNSTVPGLFGDICRNFPSLPECFIFVAVRTAKVPFIPLEERVLIQKINHFKGFYKCIIRIGFMDTITMDTHLKVQIISKIKLQGISNSEKDNPIRFIQIFGKETIRSENHVEKVKLKNMFPWMWREIRGFVIEWIFFPLNELQSKAVSIASKKNNSNDDILFIGKEVEI